MSLKKKPVLEFFKPCLEKKIELPFLEGGISAGFPSPAMDFLESKVDINSLLIKNPKTTFYARVSGNSMIDTGIHNDDYLVVDRSLEAEDNKIAICFIDGEFTVKRIHVEKECLYLMPENEDYKPIKVTEENQLIIWGMVTYVIKKV